jgi:hypothetical protein
LSSFFVVLLRFRVRGGGRARGRAGERKAQAIQNQLQERQELVRRNPILSPSLPPSLLSSSSSQQAQDLTKTSCFFQGARDPLEGEEGEEGGREERVVPVEWGDAEPVFG